jgi:predicted nucleic-acid-binding Zn-ribbon protein
MEKCLKCGSTNREQGAIFPRGTPWDVRYQAQDSFFLSRKKEIVALACLSCGHVELLLKDIADTQQEKT